MNSGIDGMLGRPEVDKIKDVLPDLERSVICKILDANEWSVDRGIDAALAYSVHKSNKQEGGCLEMPTGDSLSPVGRSPRGMSNGDGDDQVAEDDFYAHYQHPTALRGLPVLLKDSFLCPPKFRLTVDTYNDVYVDFSILFNRTQEKLGIVIETTTKEESPDSELSVRDLTRRQSLARSAGLEIGDIIAGIDLKYFSPGT